jgi:SAM-dependent methyltransferase
MFSTFDARSGICEIGVWLSASVQGRGLMTRAASHLIEWAFHERGMSRVAWHTDTRNARSRSVAQRLGFTFEGVQRSSHVVADERQDAQVWSLLAHEWTGTPDARKTFGEDIGQRGWLTAAEWRRFLGWAGLARDRLLLDIACGNGGPAVYAATETGCEVIGVDRDSHAIAMADRLAKERRIEGCVHFVEADACLRLPFRDASVDAITCVDAIHRFPDRAAVLAEWRRVLRPGGHLIYTDPVVLTGAVSHAELAARSPDGMVTPPEMNQELLASAGFDVIRCDDTTDSVATLAGLRHDALAHKLAAERRLSRYTLHAVA